MLVSDRPVAVFFEPTGDYTNGHITSHFRQRFRGFLNQQLKEYGPDSYIGKPYRYDGDNRNNILYDCHILAIGVKKTRFTMWVALISGLSGIISSVIICRILP